MRNYFLIILTFWSCTQGNLDTENEPSLFQTVPPNHSGVTFQNRINESPNLNGILYEYLYNGGGVAAGDLNGDDLPDLIFISNLETSVIYINQGAFRFLDVTKTAGFNPNAIGFPTGVTLVDINADGKLDIYVSKSGKFSNPEHRKNLLYVNQGNDDHQQPIFEEQGAEFGLDLPHHSTQSSFFDYDRDGDLDMFLLNHGTASYEDHLLPQLMSRPADMHSDRLYENQNGRFVDVSQEAGLINNALSFGLGVSIGDLNNDGWPDVLVGHDFSEKDHLYLNQQNGTFKEIMNESAAHISFFSMGNDVADFNNDGWLDFMTVDMVSEHNYDIKTSMSGMNPKQFESIVDMGLHHQYMYNALQLNRGVVDGIPKFSDVAQLSGVSSTDWSWSPLFFDADNDGFKDLFISNGVKRDFRNNDYVNYKKKRFEQFFKENPDNTRGNKLKARTLTAELTQMMPERKKPNYFFQNNGEELGFKKTQWIDHKANSSNGAVFTDLDNDGDLDLVLNNMDQIASIYENTGASKNYLAIKLNGSEHNQYGVGARVKLYANGELQIQENYITRGFQSASSGPLHFGLGDAAQVDSIIVKWPDGKVSIQKHFQSNQTITMSYEHSDVRDLAKPKTHEWFTDYTNDSGLNFLHQENEFNDFERESLLPHRMSRLRPALAVGDVNGDGTEDVFIGGAIRQSGQFFIQQSAGFTAWNQSAISQDSLYEDIDAKLFDMDGDGDLDLYVVSGGNEYEMGSQFLQDRIYQNSDGRFEKINIEALPSTSGGCVEIADMDQDGDLDVFVGGRQWPGRYPISPDSYLLLNESKNGRVNFTEAQKFEALGMVTDATWADVDGDDWKDLLVVGEWMIPKILYNAKGKLSADQDNIFADQEGWWMSVLAEDFDQDGDLDFVAGNNGLNYKYKASPNAPFEIYQADFDSNGAADIVLAYPENGTVYPLRGRQCSSNQMPFIKEKFKSYHEFGEASLQQVYGETQLGEALHKQAKNFASTYFENLGNGAFSASSLPILSQLSVVNDMLTFDANNDGNKDIILVGNNYAAEVETPRNDAGMGLVLLGDGRGNFQSCDTKQSGLFVLGDAKSIASLKLDNDIIGLVIAHNSAPVQFIIQKNKKTNEK